MGTEQHPLLAALEKWGKSDASLAIELGISPQMFSNIKMRCKAGGKTPSGYVLRLSQLTGLRPAFFRPDLYIEEWTL